MLPPAGRPRAHELGVRLGVYEPGPKQAITDVAGVRVGQVTLIEGEDLRTGVTAIHPHPGNAFQERVPAGFFVANGFGKWIGSTQLEELGELETPIVLTNTLCAARAADALIGWVLEQPGNEGVRSVNPVVGETNDGRLNRIRRRRIEAAHVLAALQSASADEPVAGNVGAGTGCVALGYKGGIGHASRLVPTDAGLWTLGVLVQANFGGRLSVAGSTLPPAPTTTDHDGSIVIVLATDAPLSDRNLRRLALRSVGGLARSGAALSHGSGDYALAFSTHPQVRRRLGDAAPRSLLDLPNEATSPLFAAAIEATESAILDALCAAQTLCGVDGRCVSALPIEALAPLLRRLER